MAQASPSGMVTPTAAAQLCLLPVWWAQPPPSGQGEDVHVGFVSVPGGAFIDGGVVPAPSQQLSTIQLPAAAFLISQQTWVRATRELISPDGTEFVYWKADPSGEEVHVVDIASRADRTVYSGATFLFPIAFAAKGIYLVHAINIRQSSFEKLYLLNPAGGTPQLVPGSDRHMYQYG